MDISPSPAHRDDLLSSAGPSTDNLHSLPKSGSQNIDSSPATISSYDLQLLDSPGMLNTFDRHTFLSILGAASSSLENNSDEFPAISGDAEKWAIPSESNHAGWKSYGLPFAEHDSFIHQDTSEVSLEYSHPENSEFGTVELVNWCHEESGRDECGQDIELLEVSSPSAEHRGSTVTTNSEGSYSFFDAPRKRLEQRDSFDKSDAMEDDEGLKLNPERMAHTSRNLVSERRRRKELNEKLYCLRAIVPKISKMNKASIVGDAISYVKDLQKQVENMQVDILNLQTKKNASAEVGLPDCVNGVSSSELLGEQISKHKIVEIEVSQMEGQTYQLRIHCKKSPGVSVQLTRALEALDFQIVNASLTSVRDHIFSTIIVKMTNCKPLRTEELKKLTVDLVAKFGLHL